MFGADMYEIDEKKLEEFARKALAKASKETLAALVIDPNAAQRLAMKQLTVIVSKGECVNGDLDTWVDLATGQYDEGPSLRLFIALSSCVSYLSIDQLGNFFRKLRHMPVQDENILKAYLNHSDFTDERLQQLLKEYPEKREKIMAQMRKKK